MWNLCRSSFNSKTFRNTLSERPCATVRFTKLLVIDYELENNFLVVFNRIELSSSGQRIADSYLVEGGKRWEQKTVQFKKYLVTMIEIRLNTNLIKIFATLVNGFENTNLLFSVLIFTLSRFSRKQIKIFAIYSW